MKKLTKRQKHLADKAVQILQTLYEQGVWAMIIDGGGGNSGLTFWRPTEEETFYAYEIVSNVLPEKKEEFEEKSYTPNDSNGLPIDVIVP